MGSSLVQGQTYVRLGDDTLAADGSTLTVSNIPSGYRFLIIYTSLTSEAGASANTIKLNFNSDTAADHYKTQYIKAAAAVLSSNFASAAYALIIDSIDNNEPTSLIIQINQYPLTGTKAFSSYGGTYSKSYSTAGTWTGTDEVNAVSIAAVNNKFKAGSQIIVYGVR